MKTNNVYTKEVIEYDTIYLYYFDSESDLYPIYRQKLETVKSRWDREEIQALDDINDLEEQWR
jgi:hypothetical protein